MCIIVAKKKSVKMPERKILKQCFKNNPDGAGIMWSENNSVHIQKGFMEYAEFDRFISDLENRLDLEKIALVMHFRITTHGNTNRQTCHPFPISNRIKDLKRTSFKTDIGVAHNGIIPIDCIPKLSDTQTYIIRKLSSIKKIQPDFYNNDYVMRKIEYDIKSKMCFLTAKGDAYTLGQFVEEKGVMYSNTSFKSHYFSLFNFLSETEISVCPIYGYIFIKGDLYESEGLEFYMDKSNKVYQYDYIYNFLVPLENTRAYTYQGVPYHFNDEEALKINLWEGDECDESIFS